MQIIGILETIDTGVIEITTVDCQDYREGVGAIRRTLPEGVQLLSVRCER